jgi:ATP-dependent DNA helicase RecG
MKDATALEDLLADVESPHVERKSSANDGEKIRQAICAFANDLPGDRQPGYLFIGVDDAGGPAGLRIDDQLLLKLAGMRSDGNILPLPSLVVEKVILRGAPVAVVEVLPSEAPPVRFKGQIWVRVGPRRDVASVEEERRLTERGVASALTFDRRPCLPSSLDDLDIDSFRRGYLPRVIDAGVLRENQRSVEIQLASLRLFDVRRRVPTHAGVLAFGHDPLQFLPGAFIQFTRYDGRTRAAPVLDHKDVRGSLPAQLQRLDDLVSAQIRVAMVAGHGFVHEPRPDYPLAAIRELVLNAVMHRTYEGTSAPVRLHWFNERIEVTSPGGLYGHVTPENFGHVNDYRNPVIAEVMKSLGYVEGFGSGIARVHDALDRNGNPPAAFGLEPAHVAVTVHAAPTLSGGASKGRPSPVPGPAIPEPDAVEEPGADAVDVDDAPEGGPGSR